MSMRSLKSFREKHPLIAALIAINLVVAVGWAWMFGSRWLETRRFRAAQLEETIENRIKVSGFTRDDALRLHDVGMSSQRTHRLDDDELTFLLSHLDAPGDPGRPSLHTKLPFLFPLLTAWDLTPVQRSKVTPVVVRFIQREPSGPYDAPLFIAVRVLRADHSSSAVTALNKLSRDADPTRRLTFDKAATHRSIVEGPKVP